MLSTEPSTQRFSTQIRFEQLGRAIWPHPSPAVGGRAHRALHQARNPQPLWQRQGSPALHILTKAFAQELVDQDTVVVESSSGNFAIALATICRTLGVEFVPVIDININPANEQVLRTLCDRVELVTERDHTGGCLLTRLARVKEMCEEIPNAYWPNQYANPWNAEAHRLGTGTEICDAVPTLDYVFIGVSSGGTVTGCHRSSSNASPTPKSSPSTSKDR